MNDLISRQAALDALKNVHWFMVSAETNTDIPYITNDDVDSINVHIDCDAVRRAILDVPVISGWVSVKDRLPDKGGQYLCWFGGNVVCKGAAIATYLEEWKAFGSLESLETYPNVTHWLLISEPLET